MTKITTFSPNTPDGEVRDMTAEEETQRQADIAKFQEEQKAHKQALEDNANLKASAKAKLVAGEALTQEEADIIVL